MIYSPQLWNLPLLLTCIWDQTHKDYAKGVQRKLISESETLAKAFATEMNTEEKPEFVMNLGDSIVVDLQENQITVDVKGNDPAKFEFSFKEKTDTL